MSDKQNDPGQQSGSKDKTMLANSAESYFAMFGGATVRADDRQVARVFQEIETTLREIMAQPLVANDLHCQSLLARIQRAGTIEALVERVVAFQLYISRLAAATRGEDLPSAADIWSHSGTASPMPASPIQLTDEDAPVTRMRLQLR